MQGYSPPGTEFDTIAIENGDAFLKILFFTKHILMVACCHLLTQTEFRLHGCLNEKCDLLTTEQL